MRDKGAQEMSAGRKMEWRDNEEFQMRMGIELKVD